MAKTNFKSIDEYHHQFSEETINRLMQIREIVHKIVPNVEEIISYQIPAFKINKKYILIYYCAFSKHITISSPWSELFLANFKEELEGYKISKAAIQFPNDKPLPIELILKILNFRKDEILLLS